ncbi:MAG: hypothetical protein EKK41_05745 [Hyphomicrobiales bacterium]|nr:MAG: hypothetical protein EKK41_05745 [Hyphomicrobiales bacterium]
MVIGSGIAKLHHVMRQDAQSLLQGAFVDSYKSSQQLAEDFVERLMRNELEVMAQVRAMLEAHRERRLELRRELHGLMGQLGQFPETNNVVQLRLVKGGAEDASEASLYV